MTDQPDSSPPPALRDHTPLILLSVAFAFIAFDCLDSWHVFGNDQSQLLIGVITGVMAFQMMFLAAWVAMGAGSIWTRLAWAAALYVLRCSIGDWIGSGGEPMDCNNFRMVHIADIGMITVAVVMFSIFRALTGFRLEPRNRAGASGFQFDIKHLLFLTTVWAVALAATAQLKFKSDPPLPSPSPNVAYELQMNALQEGIFLASVLVTIIVPFSILHGRPTRRALTAAVGFWLITTIALIAAIAGSGPGSTSEVLITVLGLQVGALLTGIAAAIPLRLAGLHLVRSPKAQ